MKTNSRKAPNFFKFSALLIKMLVAEGRIGTSLSYSKATASFQKFLISTNEVHGDDLTIDKIDDMLIYKYNRHLAERGVVRNSISFYNRNIRAIYNKAVKKYRFPDHHPFTDVYTGVDQTKNRAISESSIAKIMRLEIPKDKSMELARDLFIFSYAMRGIAFVDMAYLKKSNIRGNYIHYARKKTGANMVVRIESIVMQIIEKYRKDDSEYLLPILQDSPEDEVLMYHHYQAKLSLYNRKLKDLSTMIHERVTLTSYVSRHSWATIARNINVPMSVISEGLGHSSERMTRIYLGSFNTKLIDNANRKMLGRIKSDMELE